MLDSAIQIVYNSNLLHPSATRVMGMVTAARSEASGDLGEATLAAANS